MSRVSPKKKISDPTLEKMIAGGNQVMGFESVDSLIMAHQPEMLKATGTWIQSVLQNGTIDAGLKRMMGYITSTASGCTYCSAHTNFTARFYQVDEAKMKEAWDFEQSALFTEAEKAALHLALQSSQIPNASTDEDFIRLRKYYNDEEIVELVFTISLYAFLNRFNSTMQTELEDKPSAAFQKMKQDL